MLRLHPSHRSYLNWPPPLQVRLPPSGITDSHGVTGGVYNTWERIHPDILIRDYSRFQLHEVELQTSIRTETGFGDLLRLTVLRLIIPVAYTHLSREDNSKLLLLGSPILKSPDQSLRTAPRDVYKRQVFIEPIQSVI